jgi:hypothetical protein
MDTFDGSADALQVSRLLPDGKISRNTGIEVLPFLVQAMSLTGPAGLRCPANQSHRWRSLLDRRETPPAQTAGNGRAHAAGLHRATVTITLPFL